MAKPVSASAGQRRAAHREASKKGRVRGPPSAVVTIWQRLQITSESVPTDRRKNESLRRVPSRGDILSPLFPPTSGVYARQARCTPTPSRVRGTNPKVSDGAHYRRRTRHRPYKSDSERPLTMASAANPPRSPCPTEMVWFLTSSGTNPPL
jgi:hypothetical protein